ncbi:MAG: hypothetical protein KDK78_06385, partial [Chlamydiia bacterium]|nr:hypothetical protein [Chlamydiia bacterium]
LLPDGIEQVFLAPKPGLSGRDLVYAPAILCAAELGFSDRKLGLDTQRYVCELYPICGQRKLSLKNPLHYQSPLDGLLRKGLDGVCFQELPAFASKA